MESKGSGGRFDVTTAYKRYRRKQEVSIVQKLADERLWFIVEVKRAKMSNRTWDFLDKTGKAIMIMLPIIPFLFLLPLFLLTPPAGSPTCEPVRDDCCTHWEDCVEKCECFVPPSGPNKESNENRASEK